MAGRPTLLTPDLVDKAARLASDGLPLAMIATGLGVSERTLQRWVKEADEQGEDSLHYQFRQVIHRAYDKIGAQHLRNINDQSANGVTQAATWWLTHHPRFRDHFSDAAATRREVQRTMGEVVNAIEATPGLSVEQREAVLLSLAARGLGGTAAQ